MGVLEERGGAHARWRTTIHPPSASRALTRTARLPKREVLRACAKVDVSGWESSGVASSGCYKAHIVLQGGTSINATWSHRQDLLRGGSVRGRVAPASPEVGRADDQPGTATLMACLGMQARASFRERPKASAMAGRAPAGMYADRRRRPSQPKRLPRRGSKGGKTPTPRNAPHNTSCQLQRGWEQTAGFFADADR